MFNVPVPAWSRRSFLAFVVLASVLAGGCRNARPAIGDGYPRSQVPTMRDVAEQMLSAGGDSSIRIAVWTEPGDLNVTRDVEQAARFAADPSVVVVVGHAGSRGAIAAAETYNRAGLPQIVPTATAAALHDAGPYTFPLAPSNREQATLLVSYALDTLRAANVSMMFVGDAYGMDLRDGVVAALEARGKTLAGQSLLTGWECTAGDDNPAEAIARAHLKRARSDVVIVAMSPIPSACVARTLIAADPALHLLFSDSVDPAPEFIAPWPVAVRHRLHYVSLWAPGDGPLDSLVVQHADDHLGRAVVAADAFEYDAFLLAATAIREGGGTREGVREWLQSLGRSRPPYAGVTGEIRFDRPRVHRMRTRSFGEHTVR